MKLKLFIASLLVLIPRLLFADGNVTVITKTKTVTSTPTITSGAAYSSGNLVGGKGTLSNSVRPGILSGMISSVTIMDKSTQNADMDVIFFNADPSGTTYTDRAAYAPTDADMQKVICRVQVRDKDTFSANGQAYAQNVNCPFNLASNSANILYYVFVVRGTPTYTSTTDLTLSVGILQD